MAMSETRQPPPTNFIANIVKNDKEKGAWEGKTVLRFPPEPNGHLHLGHAKAVCLNYSLAVRHKGVFHLRFDDTNPEKENDEFVESIKRDVRWLGADWGESLFFASDYFDKLYEFAIELIKKGKAFVDDLSAEEIREFRGDLKGGGRNSPHRERSVDENLKLFTQMKEGAFENGAKCLRAKIDMSSPNINMRDPVIYRIRHASHHRTGKKWCIYPTYDFTHPLSDSIEKITHSLCTLEFEDHRPLYDWPCRILGIHHPRQIEFARLNLDYTVMSKRLLSRLIEENFVTGWDDPRLPTIAGMRRRGFSPKSIRNFCEQIGVTKKESVISIKTLESCIREELNKEAPRRFAVVNPLKVTVVNWEGEDKAIDVPNHPLDPSQGKRPIMFGRNLYMEKEDFSCDPPPKYFRLAPGKNIRFKYAYILEYEDHTTNEQGETVEVKCRYLPDSLGGVVPDGIKKPKAIVNWLSCSDSMDIVLRLYDRLLNVPSVKGEDINKWINPSSLTVCKSKGEKSLEKSQEGDIFQFERQGYFRVDEDSRKGALVFNRTVTLKDAWKKT